MRIKQENSSVIAPKKKSLKFSFLIPLGLLIILLFIFFFFVHSGSVFVLADNIEDTSVSQSGLDENENIEIDTLNQNRILAEGSSGEIDDIFSVYFLKPFIWTREESATVEVEIDNRSNDLATSIKAKVDSGEWNDITSSKKIVLLNDGIIYVEITTENGKTITKSQSIEIFDREAPTIRASTDGNILIVEATDTQSGVESIFVDGNEVSYPPDGSVKIELDKLPTTVEKISLQAVDYAGNLSSKYAFTNPMYKLPVSSQDFANYNINAASSYSSTASSYGSTSSYRNTTNSYGGTSSYSGTTSSYGGTSSYNSTTNSYGGTNSYVGMTNSYGGTTSSNGSNGNEQGLASAMAGDTIMNTTDGNPPSKQFVTVVTKEGQTFYIIIDNEKEKNNVYFLTEIDLENLANAGSAKATVTSDPMDTEGLIDGGKTSSISPSTSSSIASTGMIEGETSDSSTSSEEDESHKGSGMASLLGIVVLVIIVFALLFFGYQRFVVMNQKHATENLEEEEEEEVNENVIRDETNHLEEEEDAYFGIGTDDDSWENSNDDNPDDNDDDDNDDDDNDDDDNDDYE